MKFSPFRAKPVGAAIKAVAFAAAFLIHSQIYAAEVLDLTFGATGRAAAMVGSFARASAAAIYPDGKIIVVGNISRAGIGEDAALVRYNQNGSLDQSFGANGKVIAPISTAFDEVNAVALQPDGKIVVAGRYYSPENSSIDFFAARFTHAGVLDSSFGNNGIAAVGQGANDFFYAVAVQPNGKIVAVGRTTDEDRAAVIRFNSDGSRDRNFGDSGLVFLNIPGFRDEVFLAVAVLPNGRILAGGTGQLHDPNFPYPTSYSNIAVLLESNGAQVRDFGNQGIASFGANHFPPGFDLEVLPDGKILTAGVATARLLSNGTVDPTFRLGGVGNSLAVRSDGKFIVLNRAPDFSRYAAIYAANNRLIGSARSSGGNIVAVQADNKILLIGSAETDFVVTRLNAISSQATRLADYDADQTTDFAVLRQSDSALYVLRSTAGFVQYQSNEASFEVRRVIPEITDCNRAAPFVYWKSNGNIIGSTGYFIRTSGSPALRLAQQWGQLGDVPVGGDYDGDSCTDFTVFRPDNRTWYISQSLNNQFRAVQFGQAGDRPVPADYDYDGITDIAVYRPSSGAWYVLQSSNNQFQAVRFGALNDIPLTGDFDGDGRADFTVFRPDNGTWYLLQTTAGFRAVQFGQTGDQPVPGDYDGDGRHDIAVFRSGFWYVLGSTRGFYAVQWGLQSDVPAAVRY